MKTLIIVYCRMQEKYYYESYDVGNVDHESQFNLRAQLGAREPTDHCKRLLF